MAAKLILEPIFEADFEPDSYGFRPRRSAHDALKAVGESIADGLNWAIDADIRQYFDSIPHDRLMKVVATRVVDGSMLALIKMFLSAPMVDTRSSGGPQRPEAGVPQGGVVSPLLANIYLHLLDRNFRRGIERGGLDGRLVRYCDDFVLLSRQCPERELAWLRQLMNRLGLTLHPEKTRVVDTRRESFDFLGYRVHRRSGKRLVLDISPKSQVRIRDRLRGADAANVPTAEEARRGPEFIYSRGQVVLPVGAVVVEASSRQLRRTPDCGLVSSQARTETPGMVARRGAPHPPRVRCTRMGAGATLESGYCVGSLMNPTEPPGAGNPHARWDEGAPAEGKQPLSVGPYSNSTCATRLHSASDRKEVTM